MLRPVSLSHLNQAHGAVCFIWCWVSFKWLMPAVGDRPPGTREVSVLGGACGEGARIFLSFTVHLADLCPRSLFLVSHTHTHTHTNTHMQAPANA